MSRGGIDLELFDLKVMSRLKKRVKNSCAVKVGRTTFHWKK